MPKYVRVFENPGLLGVRSCACVRVRVRAYACASVCACVCACACVRVRASVRVCVYARACLWVKWVSVRAQCHDHAGVLAIAARRDLMLKLCDLIEDNWDYLCRLEFARRVNTCLLV